MTHTLQNASSNSRTRWEIEPGPSTRGAASITKENGAHDSADDAYPAEIMPVGNPRPQDE